MGGSAYTESAVSEWWFISLPHSEQSPLLTLSVRERESDTLSVFVVISYVSDNNLNLGYNNLLTEDSMIEL
jgi:hypothetical protein